MLKRLSLAALLAMAAPVGAADLIDGYVAYIGTEDLYNSKGARLSQPWQVLRQDRANYHRFGIRHYGDEGDGFFADKSNRAKMERMIMNGSIDPVARKNLMQGGATVFVRIYREYGGSDSVQVTVVD